LSMYSGRPLRVDRVTSGTKFVPRPFVGIAGTMTPEALRALLMRDGNAENGLAARFLICSPPRRRRQWSEAQVASTTLDSMSQTVDALLDLEQGHHPDTNEPGPVFMGMGTGAQAVWREWFDRHNAEALGHRGPVAASWSKLEAVCPRLALILQLADSPHATQVSAYWMQRAVTLVEWFKAEQVRFWLEAGASRQVAESDRLCLWIEANRGGQVTARDLHRGGLHPRYKNTEEARIALQRLVDADRGHWQTIETGGRPTDVFILGRGDESRETFEEFDLPSPFDGEEPPF